MSRTISFYVTSDDATPAPVADVEIRSYARSDVGFADALEVASTGADGIAATVLPPGDYTAVLHLYKWEFDRLNFTVEDSDGQVYDVTGRGYAPPTPPSPATCTVYGYLRDPSGEPMNSPTLLVSLWAERDTVYVGEGITVTDTPIAVEIEKDGAWSVPLVPNGALKPGGSAYLFEFTWREPSVPSADNPRIFEWKPKVVVPVAGSVEFSTLIDG